MLIFNNKSSNFNFKEIMSPKEVLKYIPSNYEIYNKKNLSINSIKNILHGSKNKFIVVLGFSYFNDTSLIIEYANRLKLLADRLHNELEIVLLLYFEKNIINKFCNFKNKQSKKYFYNDINLSISNLRKLLLDINIIGLPVGFEFSDIFIHQYIYDLISWCSIPHHIESNNLNYKLASGFEFPVGFKNFSNNCLDCLIKLIKLSYKKYNFLSLNNRGDISLIYTEGNKNCHAILEYKKDDNINYFNVNKYFNYSNKLKMLPKFMIELNSLNLIKNFENQKNIIFDISKQIASRNKYIFGIIMKINFSNDIKKKNFSINNLIGLEKSVFLLEIIADAVCRSRNKYK